MIGRNTPRRASRALVGRRLQRPSGCLLRPQRLSPRDQEPIQVSSKSIKLLQNQIVKIRNDGVACLSHACSTTQSTAFNISLARRDSCWQGRSFARVSGRPFQRSASRDALAVAISRQNAPLSQRPIFGCQEWERVGSGEPEHGALRSPVERDGIGTDEPAAGELWRLGAVENGADHVGCEPADASNPSELALGVFLSMWVRCAAHQIVACCKCLDIGP